MNSDLHLHSTASDGGYSPTELIEKCSQSGLEIVALTDHDTICGLAEAEKAAQKAGLAFIAGIELSTIHRGKSVHILGYDFNSNDRELGDMLKRQQKERNERVHKMVEKLNGLGIDLTAEHVAIHSRGGSPGRPHVAKALVEAGYVRDVKEAFDRFLAEGMPAYVKKSKELTVKEAVDWIHYAGGIAIVAHPTYYGMDDEVKRWVYELGLDGIEVYHRDHDEITRRRYEKLCDELDEGRTVPLFRTGGSDFHHESYGRVLQPLGVTRIDNALAWRIINRGKDRK